MATQQHNMTTSQELFFDLVRSDELLDAHAIELEGRYTIVHYQAWAFLLVIFVQDSLPKKPLT